MYAYAHAVLNDLALDSSSGMDEFIGAYETPL